MAVYNFGAGKLIAVPTQDALGNVIANPTPVLLGAMQDVQVDIGIDLKMLYGAQRYPLAVAQGKAKFEVKAKFADINAAAYGALFFGKTATTGIKAAALDQAVTIPATPFQVTSSVPNSGTYGSDLGVYNATTGNQLTRVASAPAAGQYSVSALGVYTFAAADTGAVMKISYEYAAASTTGQIYSITNDLMGYTPAFTMLLQNTYLGKTTVVKVNQATSGKLSLPMKNEDFTISDFDAQAFADNAGNIGYICQY